MLGTSIGWRHFLRKSIGTVVSGLVITSHARVTAARCGNSIAELMLSVENFRFVADVREACDDYLRLDMV